MNCDKCGAQMHIVGNKYVCSYCGNTQLLIELHPELSMTSKENNLDVVGGILKSFACCTDVVILPEGIIKIDPFVFKDNLVITEIILPTSLVEISDNAFDGCRNLKNINLDYVQIIGNEAFRNTGLESVVLGKHIRFLGKNCFANMPLLKEAILDLPDNLGLFKTFARCPLLTNVKYRLGYFYPSFRFSNETKNKKDNRPTYLDCFLGTPFIHKTECYFYMKYKEGVCPICGGKIKKGLFHSVCQKCGIDLKM